MLASGYTFPPSPVPHGQRIAELLLNVGAVKLSVDPPFTWTSGIKSPIYCDNRMLYSHPDAREFVVRALMERVKTLHIEPDVIAGTATAAIGWGALVADRLGLPFVYVRSKAKEHGAQKRIEGDLKPEQHIVLIEDLISTGGSSISSVEALREEGKGFVTDIVAIFSYELLAGREKAQEARVTLHPLSTFSVLIDVAVKQDRIMEEDAVVAREFIRDPEHWKR
ncbi:MAG: orotate phosphoribosyltransferase [Candidatus Peribacteraceae bacterium]|nr:orotate phosphoribosyltransferase [Candidatus Peribacteraceae bacterium]